MCPQQCNSTAPGTACRCRRVIRGRWQRTGDRGLSSQTALSHLRGTLHSHLLRACLGLQAVLGLVVQLHKHSACTSKECAG